MAWTKDTLVMSDGTLPVRVYRPAAAGAAPVVFHLHGGSFLQGDVGCGERAAALLAEAGAIVVAPDYCADCDCAFPQSLDAAFAGLRAVADARATWSKKSAPLFVAGDEAGGNIAAALALMARDQQGPVLAGQILLSPMLNPALATDSARCANAGPADCQWVKGWQRYLGSADKAAHPYAAPGNASRLAGLPPTLIVTAGDDPMRDESLSYANRLRSAGISVTDVVLDPPTGWPCALGQCSDAPWQTTVRDAFTQFLNDTGVFARRKK